MKKLLFLLLLASPCMAGTITDFFGTGGGTITISSGTAAAAGSTGFVWDSSTTSPVPSGSASPYSWTHTVGSGSNRFIAVGCASNNTGTVTAATVGGNSMTLSTTSAGPDSFKTYIYTYVNPPSGAQTITVSWTGTDFRTGCGAVSLSGVNQVTPVDISSANYAALGSTIFSSTITTTGTNEAIIDVVVQNGNPSPALVSQSPQAPNWDRVMTTNGFDIAGSTRTTTAVGPYSMTWACDDNSNKLTSIISINPAP